MGNWYHTGSRTTWISALDDRITLTIPIAQMTRYHDFAEAGRLNGHSVCYYVPGALVAGIDMEHLTAWARRAPKLS